MLDVISISILVFFVLVFGYWIVVFFHKASLGKNLVRRAIPFENGTDNYGKTLLVLGDSTGVGVGASIPEESVAGLLSKGTGATYTENHSISGAVVSDVPEQIKESKLEHYDLVLFQIGANDIIRFHSLRKVSKELSALLDSVVGRGTTIVLMSAGNVGAATLFPSPLRPLYTMLILNYHRAFAAIAKEKGARYVNLYSPRKEDPFLKNPKLYLAADGLHPSSAGYLLWYERLKRVMNV